MTQPVEALLAQWNEQRQQLRQSETQRATLTNYVLVLASALTGLAVQQHLQARTLPLSALILLIGLYGAVSAAKYHERAEYHVHQARAITRALQDLGALPDIRDQLTEARERHYSAYPRLHRIRLHSLWTGLNLAVAALGLCLLLVTLISSIAG